MSIMAPWCVECSSWYIPKDFIENMFFISHKHLEVHYNGLHGLQCVHKYEVLVETIWKYSCAVWGKKTSDFISTLSSVSFFLLFTLAVALSLSKVAKIMVPQGNDRPASKEHVHSKHLPISHTQGSPTSSITLVFLPWLLKTPYQTSL